MSTPVWVKEMTVQSRRRTAQLIAFHRQNGVLIPDSSGIFIGENVKIQKGTVLLHGTVLLGSTTVGSCCCIGPNSTVYNSFLENDVRLFSVLCLESHIGQNADLGPFVHLRPGSIIEEGAHLGNFTEVKNSRIGAYTKVSHLTYVGDSDVGQQVNIGCGCVTVNYSGKSKARCTVGDHAFIGCNTNLVAPVHVGAYAYTAAGSTVTEDVPENALAIARARQVNKINWVLKKKPYKGMS